MQVSKAFVAATVAALGLAAVPPSSATAAGSDGPSFSCVGVKGWVERTICGDPSLAEKDLRMAMAYRSLVDQAREGGGPGADLSRFRDDQRAWLARRNQCRTRS